MASLEQLDSLDDLDVVINHVGEPIIDKCWSDQQKSIITQSRLQITKKLVDLIVGSKQRRKVFLSGSAPEKNQVFTQSCARVLGRIAVLAVPQKLLALLLGESSCFLLSSQRVVPQWLLDSGYKFRFPTLNIAL